MKVDKWLKGVAQTRAMFGENFTGREVIVKMLSIIERQREALDRIAGALRTGEQCSRIAREALDMEV